MNGFILVLFEYDLGPWDVCFLLVVCYERYISDAALKVFIQDERIDIIHFLCLFVIG